jgi:hypothetical protein
MNFLFSVDVLALLTLATENTEMFETIWKFMQSV